MTSETRSFFDQIQKETDIFSKAKLIDHLVYKKNVRIIDVANELQVQSSYICHLLRLVKLPDMIVDGYYSKLISLSHLFIISRIKDKDLLIKLYERLLKGSYTVSQTEEMVRELLHNVSTNGKHISKEEINSQILKINKIIPDIDVKVTQTRIKGKISIESKGSLETTSQIVTSLLEKLAK